MEILNKNLKIENYELINFTNLEDNDLEMVRRWRNSENVRKWMYNDHIISEEEHLRFINSLKESKDKIYWLVKKEDLPIGVLNFININWKHKRAYFGMYANPENKIPGVGRILDRIAIKVAFDLLNLHTLKLEVIETNKAVINLHKKMGFKEEGRLKDFVCKDGKWLDVIVMGMINPNHKKGEENEGNKNCE